MHLMRLIGVAGVVAGLAGCGGSGSSESADLACEGCELVFAERFDSEGDWVLWKTGYYTTAVIQNGQLRLDGGFQEWADSGYDDLHEYDCGSAWASLDLDPGLDIRPDWVWKFYITSERARSFEDDSPEISITTGSVVSSFTPGNNAEGPDKLISYRVVSGESIVLVEGEGQEKIADQRNSQKPRKIIRPARLRISVSACGQAGGEWGGDAAISIDRIEAYRPSNDDDLSYIDDLPTGSNGSSWPRGFTTAGGKLFFEAYTLEYGTELWTSDGTEAGTRMVRDIIPGPGSFGFSWTRSLSGMVVFGGDDDGASGWEIWKSDGTTAGTHILKDIYPGSTSSNPKPHFTVNDVMYFSAYDGVSSRGPWKTDGTVAGTGKVTALRSITPGTSAEINGEVYFPADDGVSGNELWKTDGTDSGTTRVMDINLGSGDSSPQNFIAIGNTLYFTANDGISGRELWKSDGTAIGTTLVKDITPGINGTNFDFLAGLNGDLFFQLRNVSGNWELWKTDGTEAGSIQVEVFDIRPRQFTVANGLAYFVTSTATFGSEVWQTDGSTAGTAMVRDINPGGSSRPDYLTAFNGSLYFVANDGVAGPELWKTDGTPGGTRMVKDINPSGSSNPKILVTHKNELYFTANDGIFGDELWKTDGSTAGTKMVRDVNPGGSSYIHPEGSFISSASVITFNDELYFRAFSGWAGTELWKSDGSESGTRLVRDIAR